MLPLPAALLNMICTNVPGSAEPLYSVGRRLIDSYPHVPTGYELGVNCAVISDLAIEVAGRHCAAIPIAWSLDTGVSIVTVGVWLMILLRVEGGFEQAAAPAAIVAIVRRKLIMNPNTLFRILNST